MRKNACLCYRLRGRMETILTSQMEIFVYICNVFKIEKNKKINGRDPFGSY